MSKIVIKTNHKENIKKCLPQHEGVQMLAEPLVRQRVAATFHGHTHNRYIKRRNIKRKSL
jgi:hypothetical protein